MATHEGARMIRKLWGKGKPAPPDLSRWNEIGRRIASQDCAEIAAFHEGSSAEPNLANDPRSPEMAQAVLDKIVALNRGGRSAEVRAYYDPAHAPFIPELEKGGRGLRCCAILGRDAYLVLQGTPYQQQTTWKIEGDHLFQVDDLATFAWSANRQVFAWVHQDGRIALGRHYADPEATVIPALPGSAFVPQGLPSDLTDQFPDPGDAHRYGSVSVSDDGARLLLCDLDRGVIAVSRHASGWHTQLLYPSVALGLKEDMRAYSDDGEAYYQSLDMVHAALSPDGRLAAFGTQDAGHYLVDLDDTASGAPYAHLGHLSEYPHNACFSSDGRFVACNSCHFYSGVTFACEVDQIRGLVTAPYKEHPAQYVVNSYLRVYASCHLPAQMANHKDGAFLLAGAGFAACAAPDGTLLWELSFGSSAGDVDACPETGQVLVASYSGMLHVLDPSKVQDPPIFSGYHPPQELRRWVFWDRLERPIIW